MEKSFKYTGWIRFDLRASYVKKGLGDLVDSTWKSWNLPSGVLFLAHGFSTNTL